MKVHAIQTGSVRIKTAQAEGRGPVRMLSIFADRDWTDWLPTYAWLIEHREGLIVVDTGQGTHLLEQAHSLHPYARWEVAFQIEPEQEIGPRLCALGIGARDVKRVYSRIFTWITTAGCIISRTAKSSSRATNCGSRAA